MSDVMTSQRALEISERTRESLKQGHNVVPVQTPQAVFPDDRVELSAAAKSIAAGEATSASPERRDPDLQHQIVQAADKSLDEMNSQLDRLMGIYGVNSAQKNQGGQKITEALRNEVRRLAGTVSPPALDVQIKQELNLIVRKMEITVSVTGQDDVENNVTVDFGSVDLQYNYKDELGELLVPQGTQGTDSSGVMSDLGQAQNGLFFLESLSGTGGTPFSGTGESPVRANENTPNNDAGVSALDRFSGRLADPTAAPNPTQADQAPAAASRPDINQDGNRNANDSNALVIVRSTPSQQQQLSQGLSVFVADIAVPIAIRGSEATPSRTNQIR